MLKLTNFRRQGKRIGGWGLGMTIVLHKMRDINYKPYSIRLDERTWKLLKEKQKKSGLSWNLFILKLIKDEK